jgi:hypothetical protein
LYIHADSATAQSEYVADPKFSTYYVNPTSAQQVQQEFTAKFSHTVKQGRRTPAFGGP